MMDNNKLDSTVIEAVAEILAGLLLTVLDMASTRPLLTATLCAAIFISTVGFFLWAA
jgi:hypothetical protein